MLYDWPTSEGGNVLFSCLCVTEDRPAFLPWLLWNFEKQTHPHCELVVVDSSVEPIKELLPGHVTYHRAEHGASVGAKRNIAVDLCQGEAFTWMDDDDWQHPDKCAALTAALEQGHDMVGSSSAFFLDLFSLKTSRYSGKVIFNSLGVRADVARKIRFPEHVRKGSDTKWMKKLIDAGVRTRSLDRADLFFWLCHGTNISNPSNQTRCIDSSAPLEKALGVAAWQETRQRLRQLRAAVPAEDAPRRERGGTSDTVPVRRPGRASITPSSRPRPAKVRLLRRYGLAFLTSTPNKEVEKQSAHIEARRPRPTSRPEEKQRRIRRRLSGSETGRDSHTRAKEGLTNSGA